VVRSEFEESLTQRCPDLTRVLILLAMIGASQSVAIASPPKPGPITRVFSTIITVPAGEADGSSSPDCPPAKCATIPVENIPAVNGSDGWRLLAIQAFYWDVDRKKQKPIECKLVPNTGAYYQFDCKQWAWFDNFKYGDHSVSMRFRNWANRGRYAELALTYRKGRREVSGAKANPASFTPIAAEAGVAHVAIARH
jgi:hypothetical protein